MHTVTKSSLENIKSIFKSNPANESRYIIIDKQINPLLSNFEFAQPIIQETSGFVVWKSHKPLSYSSYGEINDTSLRSKIDQIIEASLEYLEQNLASNYLGDFLENIIELPSEDAIFYALNSENEIQVLLTEWGFIRDELEYRQGVLRKILPKKLNSGVIWFKNKNGETVSGVEAQFKTNESIHNDLSDEFGRIKLNNFDIQSKIVVSSPKDLFEIQELSFDKAEQATIVVSQNATLNFKVTSSNGIPVPNFTFDFSSDLQKNSYSTDLSGQFQVVHPEHKGEFILSSNENVHLKESLPFGEESYDIIIDSEEESINKSIKEPEEPSPSLNEDDQNLQVILAFLDRKGRGVKNKEIDFYGVGGKISSTTNDYGVIVINKENFGTENTVFSKLKKSDWKKDFTYNNEDRLTFTIKERRFLWWWLPVVGLFFLLGLIPFDVNHQYTVLDADTNLPISGASVSSFTNQNYTTSSSQSETDLLGVITLNYGEQSLFGQLFAPKTTSVVAEKMGYNSVRGYLSLGFYDFQKSIIYLDKDAIKEEPNIPPDDQIQPCGGGENQDETGVQVKKFDLGKPNSTFLFEYFNDVEIDTITVTADNGEELFRLEHATNSVNFDDSIYLTSPTRYVIVSVNGLTNWGIRVNCP